MANEFSASNGAEQLVNDVIVPSGDGAIDAGQEQQLQQQPEIVVDPAFANYFNDPIVPQVNFQQPVYQQPVYQQPAYVQQYNQPQYQQPQQQPVQQQIVPTIMDLDPDKFAEKFDEDPKGALAEIMKVATEKARQDVLSQLPNIINPQLQSVKAEMELAQVQNEVASSVKGNLQNMGVIVPPDVESNIYRGVAMTIDNAYVNYQRNIQSAILTGRQVEASLLNNGVPLTEKQFAVSYATNFAANAVKNMQAQRIQQNNGTNPNYIKQNVNPIYNNSFSPQGQGQGQNQPVDLRALSEKDFENYAKSKGLSL